MILTFRSLLPQDVNFILHSSLHEMGDRPPNKYIPKNIFHQFQTNNLIKLLANSQVIIAANPDDHEQIYGYLIYQLNPLVIHYIYVKYLFRSQGIAHQLYFQLPKEAAIITHLPKAHSSMSISLFLKSHQLTYNPFQLP